MIFTLNKPIRLALPLDADIQALQLLPAQLLLAKKHCWSLKRIDAAQHDCNIIWQLFRHIPRAQITPSSDVEELLHAWLLNNECTDESRAILGHHLIHRPSRWKRK